MPRVRISDVTPQLECGRYAVKRVVGETVEVGATVVADGHVQVRAELRYRRVGARRWTRIPMLEHATCPTDSPPHSAPRRPAGGSTPSAPGSTPPRPGTTSCGARSKRARPSSRAELAEGEQLLGVELPDVETALDVPAERTDGEGIARRAR